MGLSRDMLVQNLELHDITLQSDADEGVQEANALIYCALCMDYVALEPRLLNVKFNNRHQFRPRPSSQ